MSGPTPLGDLARERAAWRAGGVRVAFTNGCFDLLHAGHVTMLVASKACGDRLFVGLNTDRSVRRLKGPGRPIQPEEDRAVLLDALGCVDHVVLFDEETPRALVEAIRPDVLTKGMDYDLHEVAGREIVEAYGGRVERIELLPGRSTSRIADRIRNGGVDS